MENRDIQGKRPLPDGETGRYFKLRDTISERFEVEDFFISGDTIRFGYSKMRGEFREIRSEFRELGYHPYLKSHGNRKVCVLVPASRRKKGSVGREKLTAWALFVATVAATIWAGATYQCEDFIKAGLMSSPWIGAVEFSFSLLLILGTHEMAHKWAAMRNGIDSTPPYFIPFPSIIGTMGAVIRIKSPTPDKNAAVALGFSGPVAGFLVAIPVLIIGLYLSPAVPLSSVYDPGQEVFILGDSLLFRFLFDLIVKTPPQDYTVLIHPLAVAGWVGMFVTSLNLIPMGQLDGGHIARAMLGDRLHRLLSLGLVVVMFVTGAAWFAAYFLPLGDAGDFLLYNFWPGWVLWAIFGFFIVRRGYPPTLNESAPASILSKIFSILAILIFVLTFLHNPIMVMQYTGP